MDAAARKSPAHDHHPIQQGIKWAVYTLLLVNFGFYLYNDFSIAAHTLHEGSDLLDWTSAFAISSSLIAWFGLLAMYELDTYLLDENTTADWVWTLVRWIRLLCAVVILHWAFAFTKYAVDVWPDKPVEGVTNLCQLADQDVSFTWNLEYTDITPENCSELSDETSFFWLADDPIVTDRSGLKLERRLSWGDVLEVVSWGVIILAMELVVRLQDRGVTTGRLMTTLQWTKRIFYTALLCLAAWWGWLGHFLFLWDTVLWIGGFAAIEMNVSHWAEEIEEERGPGPELKEPIEQV